MASTVPFQGDCCLHSNSKCDRPGLTEGEKVGTSTSIINENTLAHTV